MHASIHGGAISEDSPEAAVGEVFGTDALLSVPELAAYYREREMAAVCFMVDSVNWDGSVSNEEILELAAAERDVLIPFASIDPNRGADGVAMARRLVDEHGVRGFKFHPNVQAFFPNDRMAYPLYEVIAEAGLPALFHTGQSGVGSGQQPAAGIRLKYSSPRCSSTSVRGGSPDLPIVLAHPSFPWQDEALAVAVHKPQVYIDLSGWSPKYFPPQLVALRQHPAARQGPVRNRLPADLTPTAGWPTSRSSTSSPRSARASSRTTRSRCSASELSRQAVWIEVHG